MPHGTTTTQEMAFPNTVCGCDSSSRGKSLTEGQSRPYMTAGSTATDRKGTGTSLNTGFGSSSIPWGPGGPWGSNSTWNSSGLTNGFGSRAATREDSAVGGGSRPSSTSDTEATEQKTGSASLIDPSDPDDWNCRDPWGAKRSATSTRSTFQSRPSEPSSFQQRSFSGLVAPPTASSRAESFGFGSRPQTINITANSNSHPRPGFTPAYSNGASGRGPEQPMNVYTKFDRPDDPGARKLPDSAKDGIWQDHSPTTERKSSQPMPFGNRAFSQPVSRDASTPSSRPGGEQSAFGPSNPCRSSQRSTQANSRAPSLSSRSNFAQQSPYEPNPDYLTAQLNQLALNGGSRPQSTYEPETPAYTPWPNTPFAMSSGPGPSRLNWNGFPSNMTDDMEEGDASAIGYYRGDDQLSPHSSRPSVNFAMLRNNSRFNQTPTAPVFKPGRPYTGMRTPSGSFDVASMSSLQIGSDDFKPQANFRTQVQNPPPYTDPRTQQLLTPAHMRMPLGSFFNPYAMPNAIQLGHVTYGQITPVHTPEHLMPSEDGSGREGVQSQLMYDFKTSPKTRTFQLKDIYDHIVEFAGDQHGSRFVQTKLEGANSDEKDRVFREIEPNALQLMTDIFGNYVIQKFFEHGDQTHKKILAQKMRGQVLTLSLSMYGCRVVQKALDHVLVDQQAELIGELKNHVIDCVRDQNGNHVIQKAIERCQPHTIHFIINAFQGEVQGLAIHAYGCRVIQRCLERCDPHSKARVMSELMNGINSMIADQFGNYVVQHIVEHDEGAGRKSVLDIVSRNLESFSKHKFASNVVEKCLERADDQWRQRVVYTLVNNPRRGEDNAVFVSMIKDSFGNYVIQKLLDTLSPDDYLYFLTELQPAINTAKRTGCGKQVLSIEKKMHRYSPPFRNSNSGPHGNGGGGFYQLPLPTPPFASFANSATNTLPPPPLPLTSDTRSLMSEAVGSGGGDAVEGAPEGFRGGRGGELGVGEGFGHGHGR
ncbi:mRNA binding protein puf3 [Saxophila tyrrhenica]|uniref:Pumilio homology domain family member 3 n=1 Tax=Saxophila tyrrhenica TaxID=1690608 RepID=A0AAV9PJ35_9PEZI|nr:mRNA binding protein puf3 [Saxophila tyrrhenica]